MSDIINFPRQALPFRKKTKEWGKKCVLWADSKTFFNYSLVRKSVMHKKINYDLLEGKIHMKDVEAILNPSGAEEDFLPEHLQHYPIMNSKLNVLMGEELKRPFDYRVVVTNPDAISEVEEHKKEAVYNALKQAIEDDSSSDEEFQQKLEKMGDYFTFEWQDGIELLGNEILNHYSKEQNFPLMFNSGFWDALAVGEEIYQCDIVGGEPVMNKLTTLKTHIFRSGYSNKIEDADVIILEDYWSPGKIIDTYGEYLSKKDIDYIESVPDNIGSAGIDTMGNRDERFGFINRDFAFDNFSYTANQIFGPEVTGSAAFSLMPFDLAGNIRVLRVYWKSKRKIIRVKRHDPETGKVYPEFMAENYKPDESLDEEGKPIYINEAWEGTMIGGAHSSDTETSEGIFVNIRPRLVQYNTMNNPSRCHFGIVGTIYNFNDDKPYSLVDMMKPYNYLYDAIHYRLNDAIASNWGDILEMDLAKVPDGWDITKWLYYAKINHLAVTDSFKEGTVGQATGKLAGGMNNNNKGIISANIGNYIQQLIQLLEYIKAEMGEVAGIAKQREGQVSNRETVGGVERATLQSSYITERYFAVHDDTKKRALECFLETAKVAMRGNNKKFMYITSDFARKILEVEGDNFCMNDYGLVVDNSSNVQGLNQKIETIAQAAMQNNTVDISALMKIWSTISLAEKTRIIEHSEQKKLQENQQAQQQQLQAQQRQAEMQMSIKQAELDNNRAIAEMDNQTKITIAQIQANNTQYLKQLESMDTDKDGIVPMSEGDRRRLEEQIREFNVKSKQDDRKIDLQEKKINDDKVLRNKQLNKSNTKN